MSSYVYYSYICTYNRIYVATMFFAWHPGQCNHFNLAVGSAKSVGVSVPGFDPPGGPISPFCPLEPMHIVLVFNK